MKELLITIGLTLLLFFAAVVLISVCKRRTRNTGHELTGMCHERGEAMCCSCAARQPMTGRPKDDH